MATVAEHWGASMRTREPPPSYSRRDPDTASVHSSAPSYVSEAPTYYSTQSPRARSNTGRPQRTGLPPATYAPGFNRLRSDTSALSSQQYNVNEWAAVRTSHQAPQYQNVAKRRATLATMEDEVASVFKHFSISDLGRSEYEGRDLDATTARSSEHTVPFSPQEDPELVGETAARTARERRLYLQRVRDDQEALTQESKSWDFMLTQMAHWELREKSWDRFRQDYERRRRFLGRRK